MDFRSDGLVAIVEGGVDKGIFGSYVAGSVGRISVNKGGAVDYFVDNKVRYTSKKIPDFPLWVDTSMQDPGAKLTNVEWVTAAKTPEPRFKATVQAAVVKVEAKAVVMEVQKPRLLDMLQHVVVGRLRGSRKGSQDSRGLDSVDV